MLTRRTFFCGLMVTVAAPQAASAKPRKPFILNPEYMPQIVDYPTYEEAGTVIIDPRNRFLYLVEDEYSAIRYGIGVGRAGRAFSGTAEVGRKAKWPRWQPTDNMIKRQPEKYARYADGVAGGGGNPLGARALYLYRNGRDTYYRIHGTTEPSSIGKAVSNGCIRMINDHVVDLYDRVPLGTPVIVL